MRGDRWGSAIKLGGDGTCEGRKLKGVAEYLFTCFRILKSLCRARNYLPRLLVPVLKSSYKPYRYNLVLPIQPILPSLKPRYTPTYLSNMDSLDDELPPDLVDTSNSLTEDEKPIKVPITIVTGMTDLN